MIPRIFHQIWVGPDPMPEEYQDYRETWRRHHPGWEMRLWTEENLPSDLVRKEAYERLRKPAERSDIIRIELLLRFGGIYVDTDYECLRSIEPLLDGVEFFTRYVKRKGFGNGLIGATPGHPILERAVRELRPVTEYGLDKAGTGPIFLSRLVRKYPGDVTIFPREYFRPVTPADHERAYAINHPGLSWKDPEEIVLDLADANQRIKEAEAQIDELERRRLKNLPSLLAAPLRRRPAHESR